MMDLKCENQIDIFTKYTDAEKMKHFFQQRLPGFLEGEHVISDCRILNTGLKVYAKKKKQNKLFIAVCYHLEISDKCNQSLGNQILYIKAYLKGRGKSEYEKLADLPLYCPRFGKALVYLADYDMIVLAFPNDPSILHLFEVIDAENVKKKLPYNLSHGNSKTQNMEWNVMPEVINYRPESRCTTRYDLRSKHSNSSTKLTIFGKTFKDDGWKEIYHRTVSLWQRSRENPKGFIVAQPLGYNKDVKTIWQEGLEGTPVIDLIDQANYQDFIKIIAEGLAILHNINIFCARKITINHYIAEVEDKVDRLSFAVPHLKKTLHSLVLQLERNRPLSNSEHYKLIHGDFHINQLIKCKDRFAIFDFDEFAKGDPLQDLADFIVDLYLHDFDPTFVSLMVSELISSYRLHVDWPVSPDRLNWHIRQQFITKAYRFYVQQRPGLMPEIQRIISLAEKRIAY